VDKTRRHLLPVATLAGATLLLESTLTRLLAVAQFYHFAFLVISLALLGFGASGTLLGVSPRLGRIPLERLLPRVGTGFALSVGLAYVVINFLPFDSYSIAWDGRQVVYFILYYLALALPFLISGLGVGAALAASTGHSHLVYAANLLGSGIGALLAPLMLHLAGVPGAVLASALLGASLASLGRWSAIKGRWLVALRVVSLMGVVAFCLLSVQNFWGNGWLGMTVSPYKGLSYAWQYPGSRTILRRWNAISRLDVVADAGTRQLPGLSYQYLGNPPPQYGLSLDADALQPITLVQAEAFEAAGYLPEAVAFHLKPGAEALVLEPAGGLGVLQALAGDAARVTAVLDNPIIPEALFRSVPKWDIYKHPKVETVIETGRVFLRRLGLQYDLIFFPLTDAYRPVSSGAYSLAENYNLTVETFEAALSRLNPGGILVITRWVQIPPSESLRLVATLVEAMEHLYINHPDEKLVAYRGIQTMTVLVKPSGWTTSELVTVSNFATDRRYDLVWAPGIQDYQVNQFNRLPQPAFYQAIGGLFTFTDRSAFYAAYPYAIEPATDDQPFFFHFFTWAQTPEVFATLGRTWQPFGGSGYFVLLALLLLVLLLSGGLILAPLVYQRVIPLVSRHREERTSRSTHTRGDRLRVLLYFSLLGLAFLFVEIPLIQRAILLLGHPTYAFTVVVLVLLLFSGLGSTLVRSPALPRRVVLGLLVLLAFTTPFGFAHLAEVALGWAYWARVALVTVSIAPLALLMGMPFPLGLAWLEGNAPGLIPWAWAVNGCASVIASVLAAILALSFGFTVVLVLGGVMYAGAVVLSLNKFRIPEAGPERIQDSGDKV
jgi:hypothetical protein